MATNAHGRRSLAGSRRLARSRLAGAGAAGRAHGHSRKSKYRMDVKAAPASALQVLATLPAVAIER